MGNSSGPFVETIMEYCPAMKTSSIWNTTRSLIENIVMRKSFIFTQRISTLTEFGPDGLNVIWIHQPSRMTHSWELSVMRFNLLLLEGHMVDKCFGQMFFNCFLELKFYLFLYVFRKFLSQLTPNKFALYCGRMWVRLTKALCSLWKLSLAVRDCTPVVNWDHRRR